MPTKRHKVRAQPPWNDAAKTTIAEMRAHAASGHQALLARPLSPEDITEVWETYAQRYFREEACRYSDLAPSAEELERWLTALEQQTLTFFAEVAPGRDVSAVISEQVVRSREQGRVEHGKPKPLPPIARNLRAFRERCPCSHEDMSGRLTAKARSMNVRRIITKKRVQEWEAGKHEPGLDARGWYAQVFSDFFKRQIYADQLLEEAFFYNFFLEIVKTAPEPGRDVRQK